MCEFDKLNKTFASDLYMIYKRISDKYQLLKLYIRKRSAAHVLSRPRSQGIISAPPLGTRLVLSIA